MTNLASGLPVYGAMFNIDEIKRANREAGFFFFTPDTMRFFGSRILKPVIGGRFFVTSERSGFDYDSPRTFTVREFLPDGSIETVGEFNAYNSSRVAKNAAHKAKGERHDYYFEGQHGKNGRRAIYVVTANDPWAAMERLHANFRVFHMGRAMDHMSDYPRLTA